MYHDSLYVIVHIREPALKLWWMDMETELFDDVRSDHQRKAYGEITYDCRWRHTSRVRHERKRILPSPCDLGRTGTFAVVDGYTGVLSLDHLVIISTPRQTYESPYIDGLVQERRNSSALAMELHLSYTNPSKWQTTVVMNLYVLIVVWFAGKYSQRFCQILRNAKCCSKETIYH